MKVKVYNLEGKETGELELDESIFGVKVKPEVVHQVFVSQMGNQRESWADTKKRGEVRGGGKKPWAQKGTGRARHGSIRSPIWKGGGVAFGPLSERNYKTKINKNTRRLALKMCLTDRVKDGVFLVVEKMEFSEPKTKFFAKFLKALNIPRKKFLVLTAEKDENVLRMAKNIKSADVSRAQDLNVMEILNTGAIITDKAGVKKIEKVLGE